MKEFKVSPKLVLFVLVALLAVSGLMQVLLIFGKPAPDFCIVNTYVLTEQYLAKGSDCASCLHMKAYAVGAAYEDIFYFANETKPLNLNAGDFMLMRWCPLDGGWYIWGVHKK